MKLPNSENAVVDELRVREYLLSSSHPVGRFKARFFGSIGFPPEAWSLFVVALQRLAAEGDAEVLEENDSVWIVRAVDATPRLVPVYPRYP